MESYVVEKYKEWLEKYARDWEKKYNPKKLRLDWSALSNNNVSFDEKSSEETYPKEYSSCNFSSGISAQKIAKWNTDDVAKVWNATDKSEWKIAQDITGRLNHIGLCTTNGKLYYSKNCGANWTEIKEHVEDLDIEKIIFNGFATIVLWNDGTKTIVQLEQPDEYNELVGVLLSVIKKISGNEIINSAFSKIKESQRENQAQEGDTVIPDNCYSCYYFNRKLKTCSVNCVKNNFYKEGRLPNCPLKLNDIPF